MKKKVSKIISSIDFTSSNQIIFKGKPVFNETFLSFDKNNILNKLNHIFYNHFYIIEPKNAIDGSYFFLNLLKKSNCSKNKFHKKWRIEYVNYDGSTIARKNKKRLKVSHGKYILTNSNSNYPQKNDLISIFQSKEFLSEKDDFYHIFGEQLDENFYEAIIRFYFNTQPDGSPIIIKILTQRLNKLKIPFHFKCLKNSQDYLRADSAVLYLDKRYFFDFKPVLKGIIEEVKPFLKPEVPLFTLKLYDGIGFAENPPNPNESFGMSRCRLIAEGIWQAHENKLPKADWPIYVINYIESQGYNLDKFYLNPNSRFPYSFE